MRCLFLQGKYMILCTAVKEFYIPSPFELDEYCRQERHRMCPLYRMAEQSGTFDIAPRNPMTAERERSASGRSRRPQ